MMWDLLSLQKMNEKNNEFPQTCLCCGGKSFMIFSKHFECLNCGQIVDKKKGIVMFSGKIKNKK